MQDVHIAALRGRGGDNEHGIRHTLTLEVGGNISNSITTSWSDNRIFFIFE